MLLQTPEAEARLAALERSLFEPQPPAALNPVSDDNPIDADKKSMEALFSALEERGVHQPKKLSEFELLARLEEYGKKAKKE